MSRHLRVFWPLLFVFSLVPVQALDEAPLDGYSTQNSQNERSWERQFRALPEPDKLRAYMQRLSARPHHVGSAYDQDNAQWILAQFKSWGLDAHIESFDVLFPTPKKRVLEMIEPTHFTAKLQEPAVAVDPTSSQQSEQLPTYNAYSVDGDVTAPLVYVNYGLPEDYEKLERLGISVKGAIVIARYYHSWRGIKPKVAAEHGAIGCIIYSEPRDDGYFKDDVFPKGPMRPPDGVQRGSVMDFPSSFPGDPRHFDRGDPNAPSYSAQNAPSISKIPVLPISYGDAQPLLAALGGPMAPEGWRGSLPIPYHAGPGPAKIHLVVESNWDVKNVNDVIATIPGTGESDEWIVRGNHYDAWVNGAEDPISGQISLLEEARAFGELRKQGWKPKRTIIYCAWDGEEPMLLGSTAWAEAHEKDLMQHAAIYINTDGNDRGRFTLEGSHSLEHFLNGVMRDIEDPESKTSVWQRNHLTDIWHAKDEEERKELRGRADQRIGALGSGTDYTAFIDHLGIASVNAGYGGEDPEGIYHSIYDDFYWYTHFSDRDFVYGRALAQTIGTAVMRMADADVLPYQFSNLADTVHVYLKQLQDLLKTEQNEIKERNTELEEGVFQAAYDPRHPTEAPPKEEMPPFLNFAPLANAADALAQAAERYDTALALARKDGHFAATDAQLHDLNIKLVESERRLTDPAGLPRRPWYKHVLTAPGVYTGYDPKTVPGVREAIEEKRWQEADQQIQQVAKVLQGEVELIDSAAKELQSWTMAP